MKKIHNCTNKTSSQFTGTIIANHNIVVGAHGFRHLSGKTSAIFHKPLYLGPKHQNGITGRVVKPKALKKNALLKKKKCPKSVLVQQYEKNVNRTSIDASGKISTSLRDSDEIQTEKFPEVVEDTIDQRNLNNLTSPLLLRYAHIENGNLVGEMESALYQLLPEQKEELVKEATKNVQKVYLFKHYKKNISLLILKHPTSFLIGGEISAQVLLGGVLVHGHSMGPEDPEWVRIHSSPNLGYLPIATTAQTGKSCWEEQLKTSLESLGLGDMLKPLRKFLDADSTLVAIKCNTINGVLDKSAMKMPSSSVELLKHLGIDLVKRIDESVRIIRQSSQQEELASSLLAEACKLASEGRAPVVVICGGRNLGKSTCLRYLVNRFLAQCDCIYHLDMDPGQPEFTLSGCLSLNKVTKPLLGPPFTHLQQPERSVYLGQVDISKIGQTYFSSLLQLIRYYNLNYHGRVPLVVNTMGWTSGLGFKLLIDIIRYSRPTHLIQLSLAKDDSSSNMPKLSPDFLAEARGFGSVPFKWSYKLLELHGRQSNMRFTSRQLRDFNICYYLDRLSHTTFLDMDRWHCYEASWNHLAICFCHEIVPASQSLQYLNASLVALCTVEKEALQSSVRYDKGLPAILPGCPLNQCLGFGIVMRIDLDNQILCIATPEPLEVLAQVNALYRGQVNLPEQIFLRQSSDSPLPYVHTSLQTPKFSALSLPIKKRGTTVKTKPNL